ncbi:MAG: 4-hydroxy-3-methylbut-2-enyl diphosphate reductase, partial [Nocardioidaceae bacterium]
MTGLIVRAPSRTEAAALRRGVRDGTVRRFQGGRRSARRASLTAEGSGALAVAGAGSALCAGLRTGDVVVATEVRGPDGTVACPSAPMLAGRLRREGLTVHVGPVASLDHEATAPEREVLAAAGALCVDADSPVLGSVDATHPAAVVRVIAEGAPGPRLHRGSFGRFTSTTRTLSRLGPALDAWGRAVGARRVLLAGPRSFCAGVVRAIDVVERALEQRGAPIYVRKQIVHNLHVVHDLEARGAVFVDELEEIPAGASVVFSAHGVSPAVRAEAERRGLEVIDATCPLVSKVHT